jgi:hypothetical protein
MIHNILFGMLDDSPGREGDSESAGRRIHKGLFGVLAVAAVGFALVLNWMLLSHGLASPPLAVPPAEASALPEAPFVAPPAVIPAEAVADQEAPFVHTVIFHLKKDAPDGEAQALIADAHELLGKIPSVRGLRIGRPAETGTPDLAKKDFQVGLLVLFDDYAGLKTYLDHPLHLKYVDKHIQYVDTDKLLVYDFVNQKK